MVQSPLLHLSDAFIQSDLQSIQAVNFFCQYVCSPGIKPTTFSSQIKYILHLIWKSNQIKFPQSVMIWAAMSSGGVGPLCFLKSTVNAVIYQEILRALHASFCWQALWRCWFHFPAGLGTCPTLPKVPKAGSMTMVLLCLIVLWQFSF